MLGWRRATIDRQRYRREINDGCAEGEVRLSEREKENDNLPSTVSGKSAMG